MRDHLLPLTLASNAKTMKQDIWKWYANGSKWSEMVHFTKNLGPKANNGKSKHTIAKISSRATRLQLETSWLKQYLGSYEPSFPEVNGCLWTWNELKRSAHQAQSFLWHIRRECVELALPWRHFTPQSCTATYHPITMAPRCEMCALDTCCSPKTDDARRLRQTRQTKLPANALPNVTSCAM